MAADDLPIADRIRLLERQLADLENRVEWIHRTARPANRRDVRLAQTVDKGGGYPTEASCPNTYWIVFVDAEYAVETQGKLTPSKTLRQSASNAPTTVQNVLKGKDGYIPEGQLLRVFHDRGQWWTVFRKSDLPCS